MIDFRFEISDLALAPFNLQSEICNLKSKTDVTRYGFDR